MKRLTAVFLLMPLLVLSLARTAHSAVQLYTGSMKILVTSGKACAGLVATHDVSLVVAEDEGGSGALHGYFVGGVITIGRFSGSDPTRLDVRYPFQDELRAGGHFISLSHSDTTLVAELHDRHIEETVDDCNFDHARMELTRSVDRDASAQLVQMTGLFDAQMARSHAMALVQSSGYDAALPYFEKALILADTFIEKGSDQVNSYIVGLATSYIWLERFEEFNRLFDTRIITIQDASIRTIFSGYRVRTLMKEGREAIGREDYDFALKSFEQAHSLQPLNMDVIAAVMSIHVRSGRYTEAVSFMERAESALSNDADRKDIRTATAMVLFKKAQKDDKKGNGIEAEIALKRAMELDPGSVYYLIALARLRHKAGNLTDAETLLEQGLEKFTDIQSQNEIIAAREKIRQTEIILKKIRKVDS